MGAAAANVGAYIRLYMYIMLYCICAAAYVYIYIYDVCAIVKSAFVRTTKSTLGLHDCTIHLANIYIFENELLPTTAVHLGQHLAVVRCRAFFSWMISIFVFDILQIPSGCIKFCSGRTAPTCTPMTTGLSCI